MINRVHNFSAGPGVLPLEVLEKVQQDLISYKGRGLSVMEMSHRSKDYQEIIDNAMNRAKEIMELGDDYEILFLQGGASTQFYMLAANLCGDNQIANYIDTGAWSTKAIQEAEKIGKKIHIAASSKDKKFTYIPKTFTLSNNAAYLHYTTNNTIRGTEFNYIPEVDVPLISDMSSDFLSRPMVYNKFALIYAGAQKNIGPAGVTLVAIRKNMIEKLATNLPTMMSYKTHIDKGSMFNTPPTFAIYVVGEVLKWIQDQGGLTAIQERNIQKANLIYNTIDNSDFYTGPVVKEDRSLMNIPFRLPSEELEQKFIKEATKENLMTLKGHRSVGGIRASTYNSLPVEACIALSEFMKKFELNNK